MSTSQQALVTLAGAARRLKELREAERLEGSFYKFVKAAWHVFDPAEFVDNWHLEDICLPYGSQIVTRSGSKSIGDIVETGWSGEVLSFNHLTNEIEFKPILVRSKSRPKDLISIATCDGVRISCTGKHPIYVKDRGYVAADRLRVGDIIFRLPEMLRPAAEDSKEILFQGMPLRTRQGVHQGKSVDRLRQLRKAFLPRAFAAAREILQPRLLRHSQDGARKANVRGLWVEEGLWQREELSLVLSEGPSCTAHEFGYAMPGVRRFSTQESGAVGANSAASWRILQSFVSCEVCPRGEQSGLYRRPTTSHLSSRLSRCSQEGGRARWRVLLSLFYNVVARCSPYKSGQARQSADELGHSLSPLPQSPKGDARGSHQVIESIVSAVEQDVRLPSAVYNIEVEGNNNYFADAVLVHNCNHMEAVARGHIPRLLLNVPPRTGKTALISICFCAWIWAQRERGPLFGPQVSFFYASYAEHLSLEHSLKCRRLIESRWYQRLWGGRFKLSSDRNTKSHFENDKGGYRMASSVDSRATGFGADLLIADDPHLVSEAESDLVRDGVVRWWAETMPSRLNNRKTGAMVVVMQRVHEGDLAGDILRRDEEARKRGKAPNYVHFCAPLRYETCMHVNAWVGDKIQTFIGEDINDLDEEVIFWVDRRTEDGDLLWPERFPLDEVEKIESEMGEVASAGQLQQRPIPRGGGIIKEEWWQLWDDDAAKEHGAEPGTYPGFEYVLGALDTAYTKDEENDPSALSIWGIFRDRAGNPKIMLMFCWAKRYEIHDLVNRVGDDCKTFKVDRLLIEDKAAGHSVSQELARLFGSFDFGIELVNPKSGFIKTPDKDARLVTCAHLFAEGLIYMPDKEWADPMVKQCSYGSRGVHDDLSDSASMSLIYLRRSGWALKKEEHAREMEDETRYKPGNGQALYGGI